MSEEIAVIGLSGRFPGASNIEAFWHNLKLGVDSVGEVPPERWDGERYYAPGPRQPFKVDSKWGGFLDDVDLFDPLFFEITPDEALYMDPQHRLFLMEAWRAIEDAAYSRESMAGQRWGIFVGVGQGDYIHKLERSGREPDARVLLGGTSSMAAARLAYLLDLTGPSLAVETACSSSLVALHLACRSLRDGECEVALAGGVYLMTSPTMHLMAGKAGMLSPTGRCHVFDRRADGFVPGEAAAAVVLKPLRQALEDGDSIYGVILGSAMNQDGRTNGITAPSARSQELLARAALAQAQVEPQQISYVETHGTGTPLGDPIEIRALKAVHAGRAPGSCAIGSVKSNIGHTLMAAGIASFVKVMLSLRHGWLPPGLHFSDPNPHIDFSTGPFYVNTKLHAWEENPKIAAISSFGFTGTNCHMVVAQAPAQPTAAQARRAQGDRGDSHLIAVSAHTEAALPSPLARLEGLFGRPCARQPC